MNSITKSKISFILCISIAVLSVVILAVFNVSIIYSLPILVGVNDLAWKFIYKRPLKLDVMRQLQKKLSGYEEGFTDEQGKSYIWRLSDCETVVDIGYGETVWFWFVRSRRENYLYKVVFVRDSGRYFYSEIRNTSLEKMKKDVLEHDVDVYREHFGEPLEG